MEMNLHFACRKPYTCIFTWIDRILTMHTYQWNLESKIKLSSKLNKDFGHILSNDASCTVYSNTSAHAQCIQIEYSTIVQLYTAVCIAALHTDCKSTRIFMIMALHVVCGWTNPYLRPHTPHQSPLSSHPHPTIQLSFTLSTQSTKI